MMLIFFILLKQFTNAVRLSKSNPIAIAYDMRVPVDSADMAEPFNEVNNAIDNLYTGGHTNFFSDQYYNTVKEDDIIKNTALLMSNTKLSTKAGHRLEGIMNNVYNAEDQVKNNDVLKNSLRTVLNNPFMNVKTKVAAAKLEARMTNLPVSMQTTQPNINKAPKDLQSYIVMPSKERIYRPDEVVENLKAGNWGLI
jgi:hypothetical protein